MKDFNLKETIRELNECREEIRQAIDEKWVPFAHDMLELWIEELPDLFKENRISMVSDNAEFIDASFAKIIEGYLQRSHVPPIFMVDKYEADLSDLVNTLVWHIRSQIFDQDLKIKARLIRKYVAEESSRPPKPKRSRHDKAYLIHTLDYQIDLFIVWLHYTNSYIEANRNEIEFDNINGGDIERDFPYYRILYDEWVKEYDNADKAGRDGMMTAVYKRCKIIGE